MSAAFTFAGIPGVRGCLVGGSDGRVLEETVAHPDNSALIAAAATLASTCETLGELLGLGTVDVLTTKGGTGAWVIGKQTDWAIAVQVDTNRSTTPVEAALRAADWLSMVDWDVGTSEIECVSEEDEDIDVNESDAVYTNPAPANSSRDDQSGLKWRAAPKYRQMMMGPAAAAAEFRAKEAPTSPSGVGYLVRDIRTIPPAGLANSPIFAGDLKMFGVADLIEFLANGRRTGILTCRAKEQTGKLHIRSGKIVAAGCPPIAGLRDYILPQIAIGATTRPVLPAPESDFWDQPRAGVALVQQGILTLREVHDALKEQLGATIAELLTWSEGDFSFESERPSEPSELEFELEFEPNSLLLEILKTQDERAAAAARGR